MNAREVDHTVSNCCSFTMERKIAPEEGEGKGKQSTEEQSLHQPPNISPMYPVTHDAYGGGMYGTEQGQAKKPETPPASETQSADGPDERRNEPKHKPPPSSGDRDIDITGQSYIQQMAETEVGSKWGDEWEEKFFEGIGARQGETWHAPPSGERWSRTWGEEHFGNRKVHKYGKNTAGERWDLVVDGETL